MASRGESRPPSRSWRAPIPSPSSSPSMGVAKAASDAAGTDTASSGTLTTLGLAIGTPTYLAPEQAAGQASVDARADLYAVGVIAYEMLTGQPPFTGTTPQAVLAAQVARTPTSTVAAARFSGVRCSVIVSRIWATRAPSSRRTEFLPNPAASNAFTAAAPSLGSMAASM